MKNSVDRSVSGAWLPILPNFAGIGPEPIRNCGVLPSLIGGILAGLLVMPAGAQEYEASGFSMRNHAPFSAIIGVPARWPDGTGHSTEISWNSASHAMLEVDGNERLMLDGETQTLTFRMQRNFSSRVQLGFSLPWLQHSGGYLDSFIDGWHDLFGLPEGIRPLTADDDLLYVYENDGATILELDERKSGFGDLQIGMGIDFGAIGGEQSTSYLGRIPWRMTLNVELPTGDADELTGNGNTDIAAGVGFRSPGASSLGWWLDMGLVWPGNVDIDGLDSSGQVFYYDGAVSWRALQSLDVLLQLAGHTALYQADVTMLGEPALQLGVGAMWHVSDKYALRFGFFEDLRAESAPDFAIELAIILKKF